MVELAQARAPRWIYAPKVVVVAGCLIALIAFGVRATSGLFNAPITDAHGWGREVFGFAIALQNIVWGIAQPFAGLFADRFGAMRVIMVGAVIYALGTALMAFADTPSLLFLSGGLLMGLGIALTSFSIIMAAFGRLVSPEKRSWSFGIATAASSMGQFVFAPLGYVFIATYGWQTALLLLASTTLIMVVLAVPMNASKGGVAAGARELELSISQALQRAFGHSSYILLIIGFFVCGFQIAFITVHLPAYLIEHGISQALAAWSIGIVGLFNVVGSYYSGVFGGRHSRRQGLCFIYLARSVIIAAFILLPLTPLSTVLFTASMGLLWLSTVPLTMGLVTLMFGTRFMATLYGFVFFSHQVGSFFGVWLGGMLYDRYGSYDPVWWISIGLGVFAALVHWPIREKLADSFAVQPAE